VQFKRKPSKTRCKRLQFKNNNLPLNSLKLKKILASIQSKIKAK
jgi:hypothetical protein